VTLDHESAATDQRLGAYEVGLRGTQQIDGASSFGGGAAAAERNHLLHAGKEFGVDAHLDLAAVHVDRAASVGRYFGESGPDRAEGDGVHGDVVTPPLFGERLGQSGDPSFGRSIVRLPRIASETGARGYVDDLA